MGDGSFNMDLGSLLGAIQEASQPRPDLVTPGATGALENPRVGTFMGRMVTPQDTLASVMARLPQGETEAGSLAIESPAFLASLSPSFISAANKTSRRLGAVGPRALVPKRVAEVARPGETILDFGAGEYAEHATRLRDMGHNVTAHDFGKNVKAGVHDPDALTRQYDHVMASNVLNTQSTPEMAIDTIKQIKGAVRKNGKATVNYPESPHYMNADGTPNPKGKGDFSPEQMEDLLSQEFNVKRVGGTKKAPVFELTVKE